jgi:hypothetical protein
MKTWARRESSLSSNHGAQLAMCSSGAVMIRSWSPGQPGTRRWRVVVSQAAGSCRADTDTARTTASAAVGAELKKCHLRHQRQPRCQRYGARGGRQFEWNPRFQVEP